MRDLGCLRFSDQRTLLHAALGRKDGSFFFQRNLMVKLELAAGS